MPKVLGSPTGCCCPASRACNGNSAGGGEDREGARPDQLPSSAGKGSLLQPQGTRVLLLPSARSRLMSVEACARRHEPMLARSWPRRMCSGASTACGVCLGDALIGARRRNRRAGMLTPRSQWPAGLLGGVEERAGAGAGGAWMRQRGQAAAGEAAIVATRARALATVRLICTAARGKAPLIPMQSTCQTMAAAGTCRKGAGCRWLGVTRSRACPPAGMPIVVEVCRPW